MLKRFLLLLLIASCSLSFVFAQKAIEIHIDGQINSVSAGFIEQAIEKAEKEKAECLLIQLNTPGGLLKSTREIVGKIMNASVPVLVFVGPEGAHAGSAGVFITMSAHISAMAPGTNIGAAHPVDLSSKSDTVLSKKIRNDASSFIKSIAEKRNKNWEWAVNAVEKSYSISSEEALEKNVVDLIAKSPKDLLAQVNGRTIELNSGTVTLKTQNLKLEVFEMGSIDKILNVVNDPNVMYVLFLIGIIGVVIELFNPGAILPGIVGVISLILAFYAMSALPVNYAGVALIIFAIILFILEIKIISHGILGIGGVISLLIGSLMLIRKDPSFDVLVISNWVIFTSITLTAILFIVIVYLGLKAQKPRSLGGSEGMIGSIGVVMELLNPKGLIRVNGEIWTAETQGAAITEGSKVKILKINGLTLIVEAVVE